MNKYKVENLMSTTYDGNEYIDLEFQIDGKTEFVKVEAPEESFTDEFYFDSQENLDKALEKRA